ncbi:MAG: CDP-diacylglycerol--glycerol-3-phosphate 3-phosphatidyltransferase [Clostridia bacterium]|jgi:CDP-diacylglycerol--glycerol-3-phosphate 3-phosphatidyltransferase|nr:CDP-diacylglycerol--glycerol-3-phosphate 3-phosphatidyltransferase [Clostridia bacterium]MBQ4458121.1 CDP-diacylglycerol--glycerol-3-phosphate 3-phosphatidyltransferase [Clostridia bacterium]MBQ5956193.1 CDP-diacylglycerol--glycerol-3-phosphate 3-phosphatidyltransferase [Clostridia bacterium]MBQ6004005.1 CDP-diacylglycerol--glycerol-3-phosphate 3-phosphatidyltransferase [Clostridia bacterium]MBR0438787.1 CDP-diacylglycerol--glycerol-3-phosphate 3-phosphatidyltransferase [Clostridia bacterium
MNKNVPNILTIARIVMVPFIILLYYLQIPYWNYYAAVIFIIASLTDMLDGMIARKYDLVSNFGKLMDPMADKVLVMAALIIILDWGKLGKLGPLVVIILLGREFLISSFRLIAASTGVVIAAGSIGKLKTVVQLVGISLVFLENPIFSIWNIPMGEILVYLSTILSIWSCIEYIAKNKELLRG